MFNRSLLIATAITAIALPAHAVPVCYMDMGGVRTDLSHMCGSGSSPAPALRVAAPSSVQSPAANVWTRNIHFDNEVWSNTLNTYISTGVITGNVHNSGSTLAENIVVEATGYAEGRTPQTRQTVISSISADDATPVTIDFGFSVPVDSWDVRVVSWD